MSSEFCLLIKSGYISGINMAIMKIKHYITQSYSSTRYKSKRRGDKLPTFTKQQLEDWLYENGLEKMWISYIESGCDKNKRPSIDRIDDYKGYEFSNMQLITWRENLLKGVRGEKHKINSNNKFLCKPVYVWDKKGNLVNKFNNYKEASKGIGCHLMSVSRAVTKKRKTIKGYILTNTETFTSL